SPLPIRRAPATGLRRKNSRQSGVADHRRTLSTSGFLALFPGAAGRRRHTHLGDAPPVEQPQSDQTEARDQFHGGEGDSMTRYYCTYFDRQYLIKGLALIHSLQQHSGDDFKVFVVCADELTRLLLTKLAIPQVITIPLHQLERGDNALLATKQTRSLVEYYWTLTPTVILHILEQHPTIDVLTYLDSDLYFFSSPAPIFEELGSGSILIHAHRFSPAQAHLGDANGTYNVGLLSFRRDVRGMEALRWWRERCLEWCYARAEAGKMGDQMYLNDWLT